MARKRGFEPLQQIAPACLLILHNARNARSVRNAQCRYAAVTRSGVINLLSNRKIFSKIFFAYERRLSTPGEYSFLIKIGPACTSGPPVEECSPASVPRALPKLVVSRLQCAPPLDLYQKASSGAGTEEVLLADGLDKFAYHWSLDGRFILYSSGAGTPRTGNDTWVLPLSGDRKPFPFLQTPFHEFAG
jgi:hypothetical protein